MTAYTLSTYRNATFDLAVGDALTVTNQGSIFVDAAGASAIGGAGSNDLALDGFVYSASAGGNAVAFASGNNSIVLGSRATLFAENAGIYLVGGSNSVTNSGSITASVCGVSCNDGSNSIVNTGSIFGEQAGLLFSNQSTANTVVNTGRISSGLTAVSSNGALNMTNTGTIDGFAIGIVSGGVSADPSTITNSGYIYGRSGAAVGTGTSADIVVNNGFMQGHGDVVYLGTGYDFFDGRNGVQIGTVDGSLGNDVLYGSVSFDDLRGGFGNDHIRGGLGGDLIVFNAGDNGDLIQALNEGGVRDGFDLRGYFDATGYAGTDPRGAGLMQVLQNGADTDVYLHGAFAFRIEGVTAAAINDTYFLFQ